MGLLYHLFCRCQAKILSDGGYLHSIFSNCGAVSAMCSAPAISSFSRPRKPQLTAISGRPALRAVATSTSLSPTYTAFPGGRRDPKALVPQGLAMVSGPRRPAGRGPAYRGKLFRQRFGGGVRLVGDNGGLHAHFSSSARTSGMPGYGAVFTQLWAWYQSL